MTSPIKILTVSEPPRYGPPPEEEWPRFLPPHGMSPGDMERRYRALYPKGLDQARRDFLMETLKGQIEGIAAEYLGKVSVAWPPPHERYFGPLANDTTRQVEGRITNLLTDYRRVGYIPDCIPVNGTLVRIHGGDRLVIELPLAFLRWIANGP